MLKYFIRWRPGWWILHIIFVVLVLWMGKMIQF